MPDPIAAALTAAMQHRPFALAALFAAGIATSIGPCAAPRYVALAGLSAADRGKARLPLCFAAGLVGAYAAFALAGAMLLRNVVSSPWLYGAICVVLGAGGIRALWQGGSSCCTSERGAAGSGGAFLMGASLALLASPCCLPAVFGVVALAPQIGAGYAAVLLAAFAAGHISTPLACACGMVRFAPRHPGATAQRALAAVSGTLLLALSAYYGALA